MEIVEKGSINDYQNHYQICFEDSLFWELSCMEAVLQAEYSDELIR